MLPSVGSFPDVDVYREEAETDSPAVFASLPCDQEVDIDRIHLAISMSPVLTLPEQRHFGRELGKDHHRRGAEVQTHTWGLSFWFHVFP